ncbi:MAG: PAS domain-containing protein, partial [Solirubrobacteraceae bacterium]
MRTRDLAAEVLESLPDPVIGCDAGGTVVYWSRAAEEAYGYPATEALGLRAATLLHTRFPAQLLEITEELSDLGQWQGRLEHRRK